MGLEIFNHIKSTQVVNFQSCVRGKRARFRAGCYFILFAIILLIMGWKFFSGNILIGLALIFLGIFFAMAAMLLHVTILDGKNVALSWIILVISRLFYLIYSGLAAIPMGLMFLGSGVGFHTQSLFFLSLALVVFYPIVKYGIVPKFRLSIYTTPLMLDSCDLSRKFNFSRKLIFFTGWCQRVGDFMALLSVIFFAGVVVFSSEDILPNIFSSDLLNSIDEGSLQGIITMVGGACLGLAFGIFHGRASASEKIEQAFHEGQDRLRSIELAVSRSSEWQMYQPRSAKIDVVEAISRYLAWGAEFEYGKYRDLMMKADLRSSEWWKILRGQIAGDEYCGQFRKNLEPEMKKLLSQYSSSDSAVGASAVLAGKLREELEKLSGDPK